MVRYLNGNQIKSIEISNQYVAIELKNGKVIIVKPSFYDEMLLCMENLTENCIMENLKLEVKEFEDE